MALFSLTLFAGAQEPARQAASVRESDSVPRSPFTTKLFCCREIPAARLNTGVNHVNFAGITCIWKPDSVILRDPYWDARSRSSNRVIPQRPRLQELLLSFYEGDDPIPGTARRETETVNGKIVRSGYVPISYYQQQNYGYRSPTLASPSSRSRGYYALDCPASRGFQRWAAIPFSADLSWELSTTQAGKSQAEISYVSGG